MDSKNFTPEQVWQKLAELDNIRENRPSSRILRETEKKIAEFLTEISEEPNAQEIFQFILKEGDVLSADDLEKIAALVKGKPYAKEIWRAIIAHPEFRGFDEQTQVALLTDTVLLEEYWKQGNDLWDDAEVALFSLPNKEDLLRQYFSCGHGLCADAQKKFFQLPTKQMKPLFIEYINSINEKNHWQRALHQPGFFMLLRDKELFDLYAIQMAPFYQGKKQVFPKTISFVAERKGWL